MSYHYRANGEGPPSWPQSTPPPPTNGGGKLQDITKAGLPITIIGGAVYAVFMAVQMAFMAGQQAGTYRQTIDTLQRDMGEMRADVKALKDQLANVGAVLKTLADRPQWSVAVEKTAR